LQRKENIPKLKVGNINNLLLINKPLEGKKINARSLAMFLFN